jgi:hypothetical protein
MKVTRKVENKGSRDVPTRQQRALTLVSESAPVVSKPGVRIGPKLWKPEDLASYLDVPVGWIYDRTRREGPEQIPHSKLGKYLRFDPASPAFLAWLKRHEVGAVDTRAVQ